MGVLVEKFGDEKGLCWPKSVAPFTVELVSLHKEKEDQTYKASREVYESLVNCGVDVLWDDRDLSPGNKLNDADLYGIPVQVILGPKSLERGVVEVKVRKTGETKEVSINNVGPEINKLLENVF
jgi:prolyl-tRNA synthetase